MITTSVGIIEVVFPGKVMDGRQDIGHRRSEICCRDFAQLPGGSILFIGQKYDYFFAVGGVWACTPELASGEGGVACIVNHQSAKLNVAMEFADRTGFWVGNL